MRDGVSLTSSQIDRLGERLRASVTISEEDLVALQTYREMHVDALRHVQEVITSALGGVAQTSRIKTVQTLCDKLRRQPIKLSRVQDIAGVRIVQDMDRTEQDRMAAILRAAFSDARA